MALSRKTATDLLLDCAPTTELDGISEPHETLSKSMPEVQNAIRAAQESTWSAMWMATIMNRLIKTDEEKSMRGNYAEPAVDSLRSALLFASAGLDVSLKRLVDHALPRLVDSDANVDAGFQKWATARIGSADGGVDLRALVDVLLARGRTGRETLINSWCKELTRDSAQSAERVRELAQALGVTDPAIRKRLEPGKAGRRTTLQLAFEARNLIAHELDVTNPRAETRQPLERIREYRSKAKIAKWCVELLDVTQDIANDVAVRISAGVDRRAP